MECAPIWRLLILVNVSLWRTMISRFQVYCSIDGSSRCVSLKQEGSMMLNQWKWGIHLFKFAWVPVGQLLEIFSLSKVDHLSLALSINRLIKVGRRYRSIMPKCWSVCPCHQFPTWSFKYCHPSAIIASQNSEFTGSFEPIVPSSSRRETTETDCSSRSNRIPFRLRR